MFFQKKNPENAEGPQESRLNIDLPQVSAIQSKISEVSPENNGSWNWKNATRSTIGTSITKSPISGIVVPGISNAPQMWLVDQDKEARELCSGGAACVSPERNTIILSVQNLEKPHLELVESNYISAISKLLNIAEAKLRSVEGNKTLKDSEIVHELKHIVPGVVVGRDTHDEMVAHRGQFAFIIRNLGGKMPNDETILDFMFQIGYPMSSNIIAVLNMQNSSKPLLERELPESEYFRARCAKKIAERKAQAGEDDTSVLMYSELQDKGWKSILGQDSAAKLTEYFRRKYKKVKAEAGIELNEKVFKDREEIESYAKSEMKKLNAPYVRKFIPELDLPIR